MIDANIIYDIYQFCPNNFYIDIGMTKFRAMRPEITDDEAKVIREFIGKHEKSFAKAFSDKDKFIKEVELAEILDQRL